MKTFLINRWDAMRSSFWFLPSIMSLAALLLALLCASLDGPLEQWFVDFAPWIGVSTAAARASLSSIGSAMVSIAGIVFSVMLVTLSITASQYGSRLLRTFMSDIITQLSLGTLIGTSLFCLLSLATIQDVEGKSTANVSVIVGLLLAVTSLGILIGFIHHVASLIQAPNVVAAVAFDLSASLDRLFPTELGTSPDERLVDLERLPQSGSGCPVRSLQEGYIQAIDTETLLKLAVDEDLFIRLRCKPGDFIEKNQVLLDTWPHHTIEFHNQPVADANSANREPNRCQGTTSSAGAHELEALRKRVDATFFTGRRRTPRQDAECALEELVEVAVRALSPGINDPFTAIACIDRLAAALGVVAERSLPNPLRYDDDLNPRILTRETAFSNLMDAAFHQIRQYGCDSVAVAIRLLEAFRRIATHITTQQQHASIVRHAKMLNRDFRQHVSEPDDGDDFRTAMDNLMSTLAQSGEEISGKDSPQAIGL